MTDATKTTTEVAELQERLLDLLDEISPDPITIVLAMNNITSDIISSFRKIEPKGMQ